ncbi:MAG: hypothetical protein M3065_14050 [Actinomycetota bacterium]|nr:hypothetical protein [Actinomycetota bacterium]
MEGVARPYEVAAGLIRELGARGPTVLVLEDIHWADEASLDVLTLLAGRIASTPALERRCCDRLAVVLRDGRLPAGPAQVRMASFNVWGCNT